MGTTAQKLQNIVNEKALQKTMTNYGLPSAEQIDNNTKFIDYPKYIFNAFLEALRSPDTLFTNLPKKTGTGASITLNDTANAPMRLTLDASTLEQSETPTPSAPQDIHVISGHNEVKVEGKNLFDGSLFASLTANSNGTYKTNTAYTTAVNIPFNLKPNTNYVISLRDENYELISGYFGIYVDDNYINGNAGKYSFTTSSNNITNIKIGASGWATVGSVNRYIQLEQGSTATDYEPYQSQTADIDLSSKNLLDISYAKLGYSIDVSTGEVVSYNNNACGENYIKVKPSTKYTISSRGKIDYLRLSEYSSNKTHIQRTMGEGVYSYTITTTANTYYLRWSLNYNSLEITQSVLESLDLQLEEGQTATTYVPYYNLEYCKIGNYKDEFIRSNDGTWQLKKNTIKTTITSNNLYIITSFETSYGHKKIGIQKTDLGWKVSWDISIMFMNKYKEITSTDAVASGTFATNFTHGVVNIWNDDFTDLETARTELLGTEIYCPLATPTYTPITGTLETQLENIYNKLLSYNSQTNITQTNNDLPFVINASAIENLVN